MSSAIAEKRRQGVLTISVTSSMDESSRRMRGSVFPLAIGALKKSRLCDPSYRDFVISKIRGSEFYAHDDNIVMSISFDPKSCGIPISHCNVECDTCCHNPLTGLLDPLTGDDRERQLVITDRNSINAMLDVIAMLATALKGNLL
jgi:hypothetical protein